MRRLGKLKNWTARNWQRKVKPVLSDAWYAVKTGSLTRRCLGAVRKNRKDVLTLTQEDLENAKTHKGTSQEKPISTFDQEEVVRFIRKEITLGDAKEYRICRLCEEREVDGAALVSATHDELMELGFDGVLARKLKMKIAEHGRDRTAEFKIEELRIFLKRCDLAQYRERLIDDLGVFDIDELPGLIGNKQWVRSLRMRVDEELRFKLAVRTFAADKVAAERAKLKSLGLVEKKSRRKLKLSHDINASLELRARENLNSAVRAQGIDDLDTRRKGVPEWFKEMPQGMHKGAKETIGMGGDTISVSGGKKAQKLPPGHRIDETIALIAPRRNRI